MSGINSYVMMRDGLVITTWMWGMFSVKHWIADYLLQTTWMVENKGRYFHLGGWTHALIHGIASLPIWAILFWVVPLEIEPITILKWFGMAFLAEIVFRHANDFAEKNLIRVFPKSIRWHLIGLNQLIDALIYIGLCVWWWNLILSEMPTEKLQMAGLT